MSDPLTEALRQLRQNGLAKHLPRRQVTQQSGEGEIVQHDLPHIVTFHQACQIQRREFQKVNGQLQPKGDWLPVETFRAGEQKERPAGIWQIRVVQGTAEFEKDFIRPEGAAPRTGEIED